MTFATLRTILRDDILAEASTSYYTDSDLLNFLQRAANELSGALGFPIKSGSVAVSVSDTSFEIANDAAVERVNEVSLAGFPLRFAPFHVVKQYQSYGDVGFPRYYYFNAEKDDATVEFGPPATAAGTVSYEYQEAYDAIGLADSVEPWGGLFPRFHELVALRAGVKAFDASLEQERADRWLGKHDRMLQEFGLHIGKSDVADAMMMRGQASEG